VQVDPELKQDVEDILQELGLTMSQAITLFLEQISLKKGLPFTLRPAGEHLSRQETLADDDAPIPKRLLNVHTLVFEDGVWKKLERKAPG